MRGFVYVLTNESMPGIVKIGFSTRDPEQRVIDLNNTSVPTPFSIYYDVLVDSPYEVEQAIHNKLNAIGLSAGKEFFRLQPQDAASFIRDHLDASEYRVIAESRKTQKCGFCQRWSFSVSCQCGEPEDLSFQKAAADLSEALSLLRGGQWSEGTAFLSQLADEHNDPCAAFELVLSQVSARGRLSEALNQQSIASAEQAARAGYITAVRWLRAYSKPSWSGFAEWMSHHGTPLADVARKFVRDPGRNDERDSYYPPDEEAVAVFNRLYDDFENMNFTLVEVLLGYSATSWKHQMG